MRHHCQLIAASFTNLYYGTLGPSLMWHHANFLAASCQLLLLRHLADLLRHHAHLWLTATFDVAFIAEFLDFSCIIVATAVSLPS
jgi:hypothetical protein